ncbi:MAG TPA: methyltransferase [Syntrophorhabdales bacterium]|nr:methyltransferase [Syntrophorhabdales bacterium]
MEPRSQIMEQANFWASRVILTAAELDVFTYLDSEPLTSSQCAEKIGSAPHATDRLLNALVGLGLLEKHQTLFSLSSRGALLSSRHPETMLPFALHFNDLWGSWSRLTTVVREGKPAIRTGRPMDDARRKAFIRAMDVAGRELSIRIADTFGSPHFRRLLDIGGASGTYTIAFLRKNPSMTAVLFDLPPVIEIARERIEAEGLAERVLLAPGNFSTDTLPGGCDLALLSAIVHQNSPEENLALFKKIHEALEPGGTLLIRDFVMDSTRTMPKEGALFALNMLVNTVAGDTFTLDDLSEALGQVGFVHIELSRGQDLQGDVVKAEKSPQ